jgi:uncharacterized damage-inducible protein DinB
MSTLAVQPYRAMARNNAWANHRLLAACARLQPDEPMRDSGTARAGRPVSP